MERASWDEIHEHYRERQPGPMHDINDRNTYRSGWQDCEVYILQQKEEEFALLKNRLNSFSTEIGDDK